MILTLKNIHNIFTGFSRHQRISFELSEYNIRLTAYTIKFECAVKIHQNNSNDIKIINRIVYYIILEKYICMYR